jgi:hypothetical protein
MFEVISLFVFQGLAKNIVCQNFKPNAFSNTSKH